jgi:hypothetical protein
MVISSPDQIESLYLKKLSLTTLIKGAHLKREKELSDIARRHMTETEEIDTAIETFSIPQSLTNSVKQETITLKSGKKIKGRVLSRGEIYIIKTDAEILTILKNKIRAIDKTK